ncbi:MAG: cation-translocating P-type ATPase [Mycoplasmatales bacterium]|nr:cation-translocating P-type ATPase [Mycoplasmatales bacterium]
MDKNKLLKIKIILVIPLFLLQVYFIILNILKPQGLIKLTWNPIIWALLTTIILVVYGWKLFFIYKNMFKKIFDMDTLLGLAAHSLFLYSIINSSIHFKDSTYSYDVFWEGTSLLVIFAFIGNTLESRLRNKSIDGYKELLKLKTKTVYLVKNKNEVKTPINEVKIGDIIAIRSNSNIPLDGKIIEGETYLDYSKITGETKVIPKVMGDSVISGSINLKNKIFIRVEKSFEESTLSLIIDKAEDLSLIKPKMQILADKLLRVFTPIIFSFAFFAFIFWIIMGYGAHIQLSWFKGHNYIDNAFLSSVTILAIACPCALGVATPLVVTISSSMANKNSLLFSESKSFEKIKDVKIIIFDKTGTLTTGKMKVVNYKGDKNSLKLAAAIEKHSIHPIADAISSKFKTDIKVDKVNEIIGVGIEAQYKGEKYLIAKTNKKSRIKGATIVSLTSSSKTLATFEVMDDIKPNASKTIQALQKLRIKTVMITGDSSGAAKRVANILNIDEVHSNVLPEQKAKLVTKLRITNNLSSKQQILFIGDGFNDILALKTADISVAFASGSDITNSLSDISILNDDLYSLINAIKISKWNQVKIIQSLSWAMIFNMLALPMAFMMFIPPWVAAIIMLLSDIAVVGNALFYKIRSEKYFKKKKKKT